MDNTSVCYIKFFANVNAQSANALMQVIDQKINEGIKKFVLLISSPGGTVFHGLSLYNFLCGIPAEVETHNFGSVDSVGVCIFCAGRKRYSVPDARFLLHPVAITFQGLVTLETEKLQETVSGLKIDTKNIATSIAKTTGKNEKEIAETIANRTTLGPDEAKTFGLIHEIKSELFPDGAKIISINMS